MEILSPLKAIRAKCVDCCCGVQSEVRLCPCESCPLWSYRMGHNPNRKGIGGKFETGDVDDSTEENP